MIRVISSRAQLQSRVHSFVLPTHPSAVMRDRGYPSDGSTGSRCRPLDRRALREQLKCARAEQGCQKAVAVTNVSYAADNDRLAPTPSAKHVHFRPGETCSTLSDSWQNSRILSYVFECFLMFLMF